jgi:predicted glycosyltransferase
VLGLRDILDEPERVRAKWKADGTYELIRKHYDRVLIYGDPGIFPTAAAYGLEEHMSGRTSYCGYVHARPGGGEAGTMPQPAIEGESKCARGNRRIVVTAGGGHDAFPMMQALIGAVGLLTRRGTALDVVIITGPLMAEARREELRAMAEGLPVAILPWSLEPAHHLDCADLVVTMGGYNSVLETICRARRAIVVPRSGPSAEQSMRAALFAQMGLLTNVLLESATPERLAAEITHALAAPPAERRPLPLGGAARAAELIGRLLTSRKPALERAIPATAPSRYVVF